VGATFTKILADRKLLFAIGVTVVIQLLLAPFTQDPHDVLYWRLTGYYLIVEHTNPYTVEECGFTYPPLWMAVIAVFYSISRLFVNPALPSYVSGLVERFFIKMPLILASIGVGYILYRLLTRFTGSSNKASAAALLWFLNPYVIWINSVWGMFDVFPTLCTLLSVERFFDRQYDRSALFLGMGIGFKMYPILLIPLFLLFLWRIKVNRLQIIKFLTISIGVLALISIPFLVWDWDSYVYSLTTYYTEEKGIHGVNFLQVTDSFNISVPSDYPTYLVIGVIIFIYLLLYRWHYSERNLTYGILMLLFGFLATNRLVNEQYFIWAIPFGILDIVAYNPRRKWLFHGIWIAFLAFMFSHILIFQFFRPLIVNFLPLSIRYPIDHLTNRWYASAAWREIRYIILALIGMLATVLYMAYSWLLWREANTPQTS
jgi:Gpi18-like mannosyltransferase